MKNQEARTELLIGPMFSGKSTEMIRRVKRYQIAKKRIIIIKKSFDIREGEVKGIIKTHAGEKMSCIRLEKLADFTGDLVWHYDVIGIDDGQFFPDIETFVEELVNNHGKIVIIAALDANYKREPFKNITNLVAKCEIVKKFNAICTSCGSFGSFSKKLKEEEGELIDVGGSEKYTVLCRKCWLTNE